MLQQTAATAEFLCQHRDAIADRHAALLLLATFSRRAWDRRCGIRGWTYIYIYILIITSNFNNRILPYWIQDYRNFLIFHKLIPTTLSQLFFSLKNVKYTSTAAEQHQHHSAWTTSYRLVYSRLQTVVAQILTTLMNRRNILAPRMTMAVMVYIWPM